MITFLEIGKYGRLGNSMFQIAGTIGLAQKMGYDYAFPEWINYDSRDKFGYTEDANIQRWFKNPLPRLEEYKFNIYHINWGYHNISVPDNVSLKGHMQSEKYFKHCSDLIRYYFEFKPLPHDIKENSIALHIRCGDYGGDYHPICPEEYYRAALDLFPSDYTVYVFSDEPEVAKHILKGDYIYMEGNHTMEDLYYMTKCDNHIIANSSYSWWGAWLAQGKRVVAPKRWFGHLARLVTDDIYCIGWEII